MAQAVYGSGESDAPGIPPASIAQKIYSFEIGGKTMAVIETCNRYVRLLEKLVQDFDRGGP